MGTGLVDTTVIDALTDDSGDGTDGTILDKAWFETLDEGEAITATNWGVSSAGLGFLGDSANGNMTVGWTINQGGADNEILCLKSSDVGHAMTSVTEADTYATLRKNAIASGGLRVTGFSEGITEAAIELWGLSTGDNTTKSAAGRAPCSVFAAKDDGGGSFGALGANANAFTVRVGSVGTVFLVDEDGDFHYHGTDQGAFDSFDDAMMLRALTLRTAGAGVVRSRFDDMVRYSEADLIEAGILGAPVSDRGLVNGAQVQRFLMGAVWQLHTEIQELRVEKRGLMSRIAGWLTG